VHRSEGGGLRLAVETIAASRRHHHVAGQELLQLAVVGAQPKHVAQPRLQLRPALVDGLPGRFRPQYFLTRAGVA
jgi:hypothetical protein